MAAENLFTIENPVFASFAFYGMALMLKMFVVHISVSFFRISKSVYVSPEDCKAVDPSGKLKVNRNDETVERHRRAHLNDMENILPFFLTALFYITTRPAATTAILLFRIFTGARFVHSVVYLFKVPQPARATAFFASFFVNVYMAVVTLMYYNN